jgi:hypothetical protein
MEKPSASKTVDTSISVTSSSSTNPFEKDVKLLIRRSVFPTDETGFLVSRKGEIVQATYIPTKDVPRLIEKLKEVIE